MDKPRIFISHITEEAELAGELKRLIEKKFLKALDVFVSSNEKSVKLGDDWINAIKNSLNDCKLVIILCSPISIVRPWINFEAGAGWIRGIPVIPLCHSGLKPGNLPIPISSFQGGLVGSEFDIKKLFQRIAEILDIESPEISDSDFFFFADKFEVKVSKTLLIKDTGFLFNLMHRQIMLLKYCICSSTLELDESLKIDINKNDLTKHQFSFNSVYNLFNPFLLQLSSPLKKIYQVLKDATDQINENIKFALSYNGIEIAPEVRELLNVFLFSVDKIWDWYPGIVLTDDNQNNLRENMINAIKKEPLPLKRRENANMIHSFMDYYYCLVFYQNWIIDYELKMNEILKRTT